jgi:hypothetical protein
MVQYHAERRSGVTGTDVRYFTDDIGLFFCYPFHKNLRSNYFPVHYIRVDANRKENISFF